MEYLQQIYYDAITYDHGALRYCIEVAGSSQVMFGSDYPHIVGDMKGVLASVGQLPRDQQLAVRSRNAERIFNL